MHTELASYFSSLLENPKISGPIGNVVHVGMQGTAMPTGDVSKSVHFLETGS